MKPSRSAFLLSLSLLLPGCGDGKSTADAVQAATKGVTEAGQQLAEQAAALAHLTPEVAKAKMQELVDAAAVELRKVRDSETAREIAAGLHTALDQMAVLGHKLGTELNLAAVQQAVLDLIEKFKNDPRVVSALETVREKLRSLTESP